MAWALAIVASFLLVSFVTMYLAINLSTKEDGQPDNNPGITNESSIGLLHVKLFLIVVSFGSLVIGMSTLSPIFNTANVANTALGNNLNTAYLWMVRGFYIPLAYFSILFIVSLFMGISRALGKERLV